MDGWIGVDLDGTIAVYDGWKGPTHIGNPIDVMIRRVRQWVLDGRIVKIFTARVAPASCSANNINREDVVKAIESWCVENVGCKLEVTHEKDYGMTELWDDRCVQVIPNTGMRADGNIWKEAAT